MSTETFDPYRKWLGIPGGKRPPTHYELLGLSLDEDDEEVIRSAAERQRSHVGRFRAGPHHDAAARLLYEIDEAELTLLDPNLRRDYDRQADLYRRRRKRRQFDPFPAARTIRGGHRPVGEESGLTREFLGVMSVILGGFIIMAVVAFALPWPWKKGNSDKAAPAPAAVEIADAANIAENPERPAATDDPASVSESATAKDGDATPASESPAIPMATSAASESSSGPAEDMSSFVALFDGKSLEGWEQFRTDLLPNRPKVEGRTAQQHSPVSGAWQVKDGQIICVAGEGRRGYLCTTRRYSDFVLRLQARVPAGCNSGILFRCPDDRDASLSHRAMEVQLIDDFSPKWKRLKPIERTGAIWQVAGPDRTVLRPNGAWNDIEIRCEGDQVRVTVNGEITADVDMGKEPALRSRPRDGFIAFTNEGTPSEGPAFRNIEIVDRSSSRSAQSEQPTRTQRPS